MKMPSMSLLEWQKCYGTERAWVQELTKVRWPDGFQCPECGSKKAYYLNVAIDDKARSLSNITPIAGSAQMFRVSSLTLKQLFASLFALI